MTSCLLRRGVAPLWALTLWAGCYQGEWRIGPEVPLRSTGRLMPTRDVERWEITPTVTSFVVQVRGDLTQRCRTAQFGTSRRTDTGRFERSGGRIWSGVAIGSGVVGGALALAGGAGWIARDSGSAARPAMYTTGGALMAGGLVSCIMTLQQRSTARTALCGVLGGAGLALVGGTLLQQLVWKEAPMATMNMDGTVTPAGIDPLRGLVYGGGALVGVSLATGIVGALWRGDVERQRVIEVQNTSLWDRQQSEAACGPGRPLLGRSATLEVSAERLSEGQGSDGEPLRVPVVLGEEGTAVVDLRALRQSLSECGVLKVRLAPDTLYEQYVDDYVPPAAPAALDKAPRPVKGQVVPAEGITLQSIEGRRKPAAAAAQKGPRPSIAGLEESVLSGLERRCRAFVAPVGEARPPVEEPPFTPAPVVPRGPQEAPLTAVPPPRVAPAPRTPKVATPEAPAPAAPANECAAAKQTLLHDCETSCGKALDVSTCVFERRKCQIDARYNPQRQRELELCELSWEKCLFKTGVVPGTWGRCVETCQRKNDPGLCP